MSFFRFMDRQLLIDKAKNLESKKDFLNLMNEIKADLLGDNSHPFSMKQLAIFCNPKNDTSRYRSFEIPKKSGCSRLICAPYGNLKWFQICLNELFKALYTASPYAMGFTTGKSIVDNARVHTNQNYVFNIDLKDFFPSIDKARVWKRLQLAPFNFNAKIASIIAALCSISSLYLSNKDSSDERFVLPQGAPTSPLLTNAICDTLDRRLHGLAKRFGLHYSRYADDISFSSMHNVYQSGSNFRKELERIVTEQHFTINAAKTRLDHCSKRQEVTGLTVGTTINVSRKYVKDLRAILHIWEKYGINAAYAAFYPRYKSEKCQLHRGEPNIENVISGKLCYMKMVKGEKDPVYTKLHTQFLRLTNIAKFYQSTSDIEYLFTMQKSDFEGKLGINIEFRERINDKKTYGYFKYHDRYFVVAVSKNLNVNNIPDDVQISLTRMSTQAKINGQSGYNDDTNKTNTPKRIGYLLHRPLRGYNVENTTEEKSKDISDCLKEFVIEFANSYPELQLKDDMGIIETNNRENLLARLVESDFDLSILP